MLVIRKDLLLDGDGIKNEEDLKMKKIMIYFMMLLIIASIAVAVRPSDPLQLKNKTHQEIRVDFEERTNLRNLSVHGLTNAVIKVEHETAARMIERNIQRLQEHHLNLLERLNNVSMTEGENNSVIIKAKTKARFLNLINWDRDIILVADENGDLIRKGRPLDILFTHEKEIVELEIE